MKNVFTYMTALLLVIWYSLSVIGFDVHTCSSNGDTYIATVISGTGCKDIHPDHDQKPCSCCHHDNCNDTHEAEQSVKTKPCCTDEWQMIVLTGLKTSDEQASSPDCFYVSDVYGPGQHSDSYLLRTMAHDRAFCKPDSGNIRCLDFQQIYSIWRI